MPLIPDPWKVYDVSLPPFLNDLTKSAIPKALAHATQNTI
jgi:hypothetical protein